MRFGDVLGWRWTPAFALVGGALLFVLIAVALVPDDLGEGLGGANVRARSSAPYASTSAEPPGEGSNGFRSGRPLPHHTSSLGRPTRRVAGAPPSLAEHRVESMLGSQPELPAPLPDDAPPPEPPSTPGPSPTLDSPPPAFTGEAR